ncbi:hypothetical protein ABET41_09680 [Metabacillus fastidiosus]|uniref:Uncharacterized protein n=1 Tax=Metabacillus fastidiosus TaxID=1458 RepID=A0ABU6P1P8_9BACI|nr:hypothetical protein [Metabacillus fastidiosus]MED4402587.1 hypothetical protein [Metabacillus fastidiosus]MED4461947.1 hypothetical protein [Metabacillus fastidiosus]
MIKNNKRKIFKYNQDDILEILSKYLGDKTEFDTYQSTAILLGTPGKGLRLIAVVGSEDDDDITKLNLENIDNKVDCNGTHSDLDDGFLFKNKKNIK